MRLSRSSKEMKAHSASTCVYLPEKTTLVLRIPSSRVLTQPNDDVCEMIRHGTIEQCRRHHPRLDTRFPDTVETIASDRRARRSSSDRTVWSHLRLEFARAWAGMSRIPLKRSNGRRRGCRYLVVTTIEVMITKALCHNRTEAKNFRGLETQPCLDRYEAEGNARTLSPRSIMCRLSN